MLFYALVWWRGGVNRNKINEMIKKTGSTIDLNPDLLEVIMTQGMSSVMQHEDDLLYILLSHHFGLLQPKTG